MSNSKTVAECFRQMRALSDRIGEIADACEKENRTRNEAEEREYSTLSAQLQTLQMRAQMATAAYAVENPDAKQRANTLIRENAANGRKTEIVFKRDLMTVTDVDSGGLIPLSVKEILEPLTEGFILDLVGLPLLTGLKGDYVWPIYEMVEASIAGEGVELGDTNIEFSKLTATPERIGLAIPVTNQSLNASDGVLETIVRKVMPEALKQLLNKIVFSPTAVTDATTLIGPFANIVSGESGYADIVSLSSTPTAAELVVNMKAALLKTGIQGDTLAWVMTKSNAALLEITPINSEGIFVPMLQNGKLFGIPVYTTETITDSYIGLGDWKYQPMGLFGDIRMVVDPYSQARKDAVDFVINADYGTKTLRTEAFILGQITATA